jgi:AcrR family transcriptional regulator
VTNVKARRPYRSAIRRGDAPRAICDAARRLFATKGYLATSIEDIAAEAGVARPTVFSAVGAKPVILKTVVAQAVAGDDAPGAVADRPWWQEALSEPDPALSVRLHARNMTRITVGIAPLWWALQTAADADDQAAELWDQLLRNRRIAMASYAEALAAKAPLRHDTDTLTDIMWALAPDSYLRLVHDCGWPVERYESWLADTLQRTLLEQ